MSTVLNERNSVLELEPLSSVGGAAVTGVDLREPLTAAL